MKDPLHVLFLLKLIDQREGLCRLRLGNSVGALQMYSCSADSGDRCRAFQRFLQMPKSSNSQRSTSCGSPFSPTLSPISSSP